VSHVPDLCNESPTHDTSGTMRAKISRGGMPVQRRGVPKPVLPHERDESTDAAKPKADAKTKQACRDIASGQVDTDARDAAARAFEKRKR
jgi:hypothetical protein